MGVVWSLEKDCIKFRCEQWKALVRSRRRYQTQKATLNIEWHNRHKLFSFNAFQKNYLRIRFSQGFRLAISSIWDLNFNGSRWLRSVICSMLCIYMMYICLLIILSSKHQNQPSQDRPRTEPESLGSRALQI